MGVERNGWSGTLTYDDVPTHMEVEPGMGMPGLRKMGVIGDVELGVSAELFSANRLGICRGWWGDGWGG